MKGLSPAEYRTILAILAHPRSTERERIRQSRLPSSTFNVARKRIFNEGWLDDVLIPNPGPCGFEGVEVVLARPTVSDRERLVQAYSADPECVLLWAGIHAVLSVFFRRELRSSSPSTESPESDAIRVVATRSAGAIPVYFDYAGLWARFGAQPPPPEYPAGLVFDANGVDARALSDARHALATGGRVDQRTGGWMSVVRLPRERRRALDRGVVQPRTMLNPRKIPALDGRRIGEVIVIRGRLQPGAHALALLNSLTHDCHVYPFLLAHGSGHLILGGMGQLSSQATGRVPVAAAERSVTSVVAQHVDRAEILVEPTESITEVVHHRYRPPIARTAVDTH